MKKTQGLLFRKFDLHIHTPASKCFYNKKVTPEQIIQKAIQMDLSAIAITDHNTGEWVDKIKIAANKTNLAVFPGVEITVGDAHNHIIAILDIEKTTRDIEELLTTVGILHNDFGKTEAFSNLLRLIAGQSGKLVNLSELSSTLGLSVKTLTISTIEKNHFSCSLSHSTRTLWS